VTAHPSARSDTLVVGGGTAGLATALQLARRGHRVVVIERRAAAPSRRGAGLLNPRAIVALDRLGVEPPPRSHRIDSVRLTAGTHSSTVGWPWHPDLPGHGLVTAELAATLATAATAAGVTVLADHRATAPIIERGFVRGAYVTAPDGTEFEARAPYTVVADGADSQFGRALGTFREPSWPYCLAHHGSYPSDVHASSAIELVLDLRDRSGTPVTGHGWMYPAGDGTVTVGIVMMSTAPSFQVVKPANLFQRLVDARIADWEITGDPVEPSTGGRMPLGLSVGPAAGPTYLLVGDAVGAANPLSRTGSESALETAWAAADVLDDAIRTGDAAHLQRYPRLLADRYGSYYKVARLANRLLGRPSVARRVERLVAGRRSFSEGYLRIATDSLRSGPRVGGPEAAYRIGRAISVIAPDS
jgi:flavin-dependent dehydrogenase